jgi:hypothetical protein
LNIVGGKIIVKDGQMTNLDVDQLVKKHNQAAERLLNG